MQNHINNPTRKYFWNNALPHPNTPVSYSTLDEFIFHNRRPEEKMESPIAKATHTKNQGIWKIYWQRADLKWHRYDLNPEVETPEEFLDIVDKDECACFWG